MDPEKAAAKVAGAAAAGAEAKSLKSYLWGVYFVSTLMTLILAELMIKSEKADADA